MVVDRHSGKGKGRTYLIYTEFQFYKKKRALEMDDGDG